MNDRWAWQTGLKERKAMHSLARFAVKGIVEWVVTNQLKGSQPDPE